MFDPKIQVFSLANIWLLFRNVDIVSCHQTDMELHIFFIILPAVILPRIASLRPPFPSPPLLEPGQDREVEAQWFRQQLDHFNVKDLR